MRGLRKFLKYFTLLLLVLIIVLFSSAYYFLYTTDGLKRAISLVNSYTSYTVTIDSVNGKFLNRTEIKKLHIKGNNLEINSDSVILDWKASALWDGNLIISALKISDTSVMITPADSQPTPRQVPFQLSDLDLPIDIELEDLLISNLTLKSPLQDDKANKAAGKTARKTAGKAAGTGDILIDKIHLKVNYIGQKAVIEDLSIHGHDTQLKLTGEALTKGNYPVQLQSVTDYNSKSYGQAQLDVALNGEIKNTLKLLVKGSGLSAFQLDASLSSLFDTPQLTSKLVIDQFNGDTLGLSDVQVSGQLAFNGKWAAKPEFETQGEIFYDSPDTDKMKFTLAAGFDGNRATLSALQVDLLTAKQKLTGRGECVLSERTLNFNLNTQAFYWPQQATDPAFTLTDTAAQLTGTFDDYHLTIDGESTTKAIGTLDLAVTANGSLSGIKQFAALAKFNGQAFKATGKAQWHPQLAYQAQLKADKISPFNHLPGIERLNISVKGDGQRYHAKGGVYVFADNIPPTDIALAIDGDSKQLNKAELTLKTLGGSMHAQAQGGWSPLDVTARITTKNLQPQTFYPNVSANISNTLQLSAKQQAGQLSAHAVIEALSGNVQDYAIAGRGAIHFEQASNQLRVDGLALDLAGNKIRANGRVVLDSSSGQSDLKADIEAKTLNHLHPYLSGEILGQISAKGALDKPDFSAHIVGEDITFAMFRVHKAEINSQAHFDSHTGILETSNALFYDSPMTDKLQLDAQARFDGQRIDLNEVAFKLLAAKQQLRGKGYYRLADKAVQLTLDSPALRWPQSAANPSAVLQKTSLALTGTLDAYQLKASTNAQIQTVGNIPLTLTTQGNLQALSQLTATASIHRQPIKLNGKVRWHPALAYQLRARAKQVKGFPDIPRMSNVAVKVTGNDKTYRATVKLNTLGGSVDAAAKGKLSPFKLSGTLRSRNLQAQRFYPDIPATLSENIAFTAGQSGKDFVATADIRQLSGTLQSHTFSGRGKLRFEQLANTLKLQKVNITFADNQVSANGLLALDKQGQSKLDAQINAPQLQQLLPDLRGALKGAVNLKGSLQRPALSADITGKNLGYQSHQVAQVKAKASLDLRGDNVALDATLDNLKTGDTQLSRATAAVTGKLSAHGFKVAVVAPKQTDNVIPNLLLAGRGGFKQSTQTWKGRINTLTLDNKHLGKWQLAGASALTLSKDALDFKPLCLQQSPSKLCAQGRLKQGDGNVKVSVKRLSTQRFNAFLPKRFKLNTALSGKADIALKGGKPTVTGKLSAKTGHFSVIAGAGILKSNIQQFDTAFSLKNNQLKTLLKSQFSRLGKLALTVDIPDIGRDTVRANVKINTPSLKFLESIMPQLSGVNGRLTGDMSVSGNPKKALQMAGKITLHKTAFDVPQFGSRVRDLTLDIFAKNGNKIGFKGKAKAGKGQFSIDGELNPANQQGSIHLKGKNFQAANSRKLQITLSPDITVVMGKGISVRGNILIPRALIVPESTGSKVTVSEDVILPDAPKKKVVKPSPFDLALDIKLGKDVRVASADVETRLLGGIKLQAKQGSRPKATGAISVKTGELRIYGQMLTIERGRVIFGNGPITNPSLDIRTSRQIKGDDVHVGANILGTVQHPEISLFSTPKMADASILSYLLFGRPPSSDAFGMTSLLQTGGAIGVNALARDVRTSLGLDVLDFSPTGMEAGKDLSDKLYVGMRSNFLTALNQFLADYKISTRTHIESSFSAEEVSIDLIKVIKTD